MKRREQKFETPARRALAALMPVESKKTKEPTWRRSVAGVVSSGTVYVDVVPSMWDFFKRSRIMTATQPRRLATRKKYAEKLEQVSVGKAIADAIADPLGVPSAHVAEAAQAGEIGRKSACGAQSARRRGDRGDVGARRAASPQRAPAHPLTRRLSPRGVLRWPAREASAAANKGGPALPRGRAKKEKVAFDSAARATED